MNDSFFAPCTRCNFFRSSRLMIWSRRKIKLIKIHFLGWIPFLRAEHDAALSDPGCCTSNIYAHSDFTWTSCPFSAKMCREKIAAEHMDTASFCFNAVCFFCEIACRYLWKKSQRVAIALLGLSGVGHGCTHDCFY